MCAWCWVVSRCLDVLCARGGALLTWLLLQRSGKRKRGLRGSRAVQTLICGARFSN